MLLMQFDKSYTGSHILIQQYIWQSLQIYNDDHYTYNL